MNKHEIATAIRWFEMHLSHFSATLNQFSHFHRTVENMGILAACHQWANIPLSTTIAFEYDQYVIVIDKVTDEVNMVYVLQKGALGAVVWRMTHLEHEFTQQCDLSQMIDDTTPQS